MNIRPPQQYKTSNLPPPCYEAAKAKFGINFYRVDVAFAWRDTIHIRNPKLLSDDLIVHECTHLKQQAAVGGPEEWWDLYINDPTFRFEQEVEAYRAQTAYVLETRNKKFATINITFYAKCLAEIYGFKDISRAEAWRLLTDGLPI